MRSRVANLANLVVKPANESGGYGMLMGPKSSQAERDQFTDLIRRNPPQLHRAASDQSGPPRQRWWKNGIERGHLDLRPFILSGRDVRVTTGGLTRVAMRKGSLVVNSSQGGRQQRHLDR